MAKKSDSSAKKKKVNIVNIHEGRARVLIQNLRDREAEISLNLDLTGEQKKRFMGNLIMPITA